jgi:hypothetical protein
MAGRARIRMAGRARIRMAGRARIRMPGRARIARRSRACRIILCIIISRMNRIALPPYFLR